MLKDIVVVLVPAAVVVAIVVAFVVVMFADSVLKAGTDSSEWMKGVTGNDPAVAVEVAGSSCTCSCLRIGVGCLMALIVKTEAYCPSQQMKSQSKVTDVDLIDTRGPVTANTSTRWRDRYTTGNDRNNGRKLAVEWGSSRFGREQDRELPPHVSSSPT